MLLELLPTHPHLLKRSQTTQNRATYPARCFDVSAVDNFDFYILRSNFRDLPLQTINHMLEHSIASCKYDTWEKISSDIDICLANWLSNHSLNSCESFHLGIFTEKCLSELHSLWPDTQRGSIRQLKFFWPNLLCSSQTFKWFLRDIK